MNYTKIQTLLDNHLKTYSGLPTLQLENTQEQYKTGKSFVRATLITSRPTRATVGVTGRDRLVGLYQIDVFTTLNAGVTQKNALVDGLVAHFPRTLVLADGDVTLNMEMSWAETGGREQQFYSARVMIEWACIM